MSLHLGSDFFISSKQLIAILNLHQLKVSSTLRKFIESKSGSDRIRVIRTGKVRSAVVTQKNMYYLSHIDSRTLAKRLIDREFQK